jgi:hypothetical protein
MTLTYIRWKDACSVDATDAAPRPPVPELSELCEIGFLLAEDDHAVLIGMEHQADDTSPGRWRLNIPKVSILERRDASLDKAFPMRKKKARNSS